MLKIKDNVDLKELEKFGLYPRYIVNEHSGETMICEYSTYGYTFEGLTVKKVRKPLFKAIFKNYDKKYNSLYQYILTDEKFGKIDQNLVYDLIKADLVEKVSDGNE